MHNCFDAQPVAAIDTSPSRAMTLLDKRAAIKEPRITNTFYSYQARRASEDRHHQVNNHFFTAINANKEVSETSRAAESGPLLLKTNNTTISTKTVVSPRADKSIASLDEIMAALKSGQCAIVDIMTRIPLFSKSVQASRGDVNKAEKKPLMDRVDSALKEITASMKQLDRSAEAIKAINSFFHLRSHEPQESLTNIMLQFYKVWTNRESDIIASIKIDVMRGCMGWNPARIMLQVFRCFLVERAVSGRSGTLVGQGSVAIVFADADYLPSYNKGWMSFTKRSDAAPVCYSKPLDSVMNWNDHFFWVDSTIFPLSVSLKSKILNKDPPPKLSQYDTQAYDFLRTHTAPFWKFPKPFLCWVGISRHYTLDKNSYPTFWNGNEVIGVNQGSHGPLAPPAPTASGDSGDSIDKLFDKGNDAEQERSTERDDDVLEETIAKDVPEIVVEKTKKKRKSKAVGDASGSTHPPKRLREDFHAATSDIGGKSLAAIRGLIPEDSSVSELNLWTRPLVASSSDTMILKQTSVADVLVVTTVATTTIDADVFTILPPQVRVVSGSPASVSGAKKNVASTSKLDDPATSSDSFYAAQYLDSETLHNIYIPKCKVTNDSVLNDPYVYRDLMDRLAPPAFFSQLRAMDYD
ncbi:hypothetical protein Tco_0185858 [Tanacetum coccineum]